MLASAAEATIGNGITEVENSSLMLEECEGYTSRKTVDFRKTEKTRDAHETKIISLKKKPKL